MGMIAQSSLRRVRLALIAFIAGLVVAGITAIPLRFELSILDSLVGEGSTAAEAWPALGQWVSRVHRALEEVDSTYPFLAYGYDWLAFGHFVIAIAFVGALRDPVRNQWVITFGLIACSLVVPYAVLFGQVRGIPPFWRFVDSLFGILGFALLLYAHQELNKLEDAEESLPLSA